MAKTFPITQEQKQFLAGFRCERLTDNDINRGLICSFRNSKGEGLVKKLKKTAWKEDLAGSTAYYVIKDVAGNIVLFFSLKCGSLFNPNWIKNHMEVFGGKDYGKMWDAILTKEEASLSQMQAMRHQDPADVLFRFNTEETAESLRSLVDTLGFIRFVELQSILDEKLDVVDYTYDEKMIEENPNIVRVLQSFSAIELVEFCKDEKTSLCWDEAFMGGRSLPVGLFWEFIVPKMLEINALIGSEYVFLFAADYGLRPNQRTIGELIKLYQGLHFEYSDDLGTAKPYYDFKCRFMCQRLRSTDNQPGLDQYREEFFANFNEDPNAFDYV